VRRIVGSLFALAVLLAACGGDDDDAGGNGGGGECTDSTSGDMFTITFESTTYEPGCIEVTASQGATIENKDGFGHTFTIAGTDVDVVVDGGQTGSVESLEGVSPGTYVMYCRFHGSEDGGGMAGEIRVQ
jgi:plastocyanin